MKNIKINLKIINTDMPYEYNGDAQKDKNIISFEYSNLLGRTSLSIKY